MSQFDELENMRRKEQSMIRVRQTVIALIGGCVLVTGGAACNTAPKTVAKAEALTSNVNATIASYKAKDSSLQPLLDRAVGWAVFPDIGKAGWIVGGSYGRGEVYEGGVLIGYADVSEVTAGFQWGAQNFSQVLIFLSQEKLDDFKTGKLSLTANVSAVALTAGAAGTTDPSKGVVALVDTKGGLMAEAAVGGQKMRFRPK
jgi:lipid-binding SYLF domain-containing protein